MATCIRRLHCWKLSLSKCWVQTSKYFSIFLGGPRLLFIFSYSLDTVETVETDQQLSLTLRRGKKVLELQICRRILLSTWRDLVLGKFSGFTMFHPQFGGKIL